MRDTQRQAVYNWEITVREKWADRNPLLSLDECQALVNKIWHDYWPNSTPPDVLDGRGRRRGYGSRWEIKLPRFARHTIYVLHETAHALLWDIRPWHGKEFARLFLELIGHYTTIPVGEAKTIAIHQRPRRVRFAQAAGVPKRQTRKKPYNPPTPGISGLKTLIKS